MKSLVLDEDTFKTYGANYNGIRVNMSRLSI